MQKEKIFNKRHIAIEDGFEIEDKKANRIF